ncbi:hypothetical protein RvY_14160 [Ramazzottius varieornatus]|uniref:Chitin-binding type-2 domain-containing protein n=1 Tax=Ramazzottius varieornatus TaxID=947166 RepID=A0A1D1VQF0_RAMVA|nr:hypothetical protein RvY_14160 [Ramazzottius varieornatus]
MTNTLVLIAVSLATLCDAWSERFQYPQTAHHSAGNLTRSCGGYVYNKCGFLDKALTGYFCTCGAGNKCNDFNLDYMYTLLSMEKTKTPYNWEKPPPDGKQLDFSSWRRSQRGGHYVVHVGYPGGSTSTSAENYATMSHDWNSNEPIHLHFTTAENGTLVLANGNTDPNKNHTHNDTNSDFALKIKLRLVFHMPPARELTYINGTPYDLPWPPAGSNSFAGGGSSVIITPGNGTSGDVAPTPPVVNPDDGKPVVVDLYPPCGDNPASVAVCLNTKRFGYALTDMNGCSPSWCCCMSYCKGLVPTPHQCPYGQYFNPDPNVYTCQPRKIVNACRRIDGLPPLDPGAWTNGGNGTGGGTGGGGQSIDGPNAFPRTIPTTTPTMATTRTTTTSTMITTTPTTTASTTPSPAVVNSFAVNGATWPASKCYDRCDITFCKNKPDGTYENSPCSRNFCTCTAQQPRYYGCGDGNYFDGSTMKCKPGNSTWCPSQPPTALARLTDLPGWQKDRCSVANCQLRNGQFQYFALDCCSRYWCYCKGSGSSMVAEVQTCDANTYFDHRSEWVQCRDLSNFGFCPARGNNLYQ